MTNYLAVNIGRNIAGTDTPLSAGAWRNFQSDALDAITRVGNAGNAVIASGVATGRNTWHGVSEDTATVWAVYASHNVNTYALPLAADALARKYRQDAVALVQGASTLHGPNAD